MYGPGYGAEAAGPHVLTIVIERLETCMYIYIHTYTHMHMHIYIYRYTFIPYIYIYRYTEIYL